MKILFECRSITPNTSCGIEYFSFSVIKSISRLYPEITIYLSIPAWSKKAYANLFPAESFNNVYFINDSLQYKLFQFNNIFVFKAAAYILRKIFSPLNTVYGGKRKKWIEYTDSLADIVIYPYHHDPILHTKAKSILVLHDFYDFERNESINLIRRNIIEASVNRAAAVISCWPEPFAQLKERFDYKIPNLFMVPFLFDRPDYSKYQHLHKTERQLIYASSTAKHKNHLKLIEALGVLKRRGVPKIKVVCPGRIYESSFYQIKLKIKKEGVEDWIQFLGFIDREEIYKLYRTSVGVVATTKYEAFSGTVMEGFQAGLPIACSDIKQLKIFIDDFVKVKVAYFNPDDANEIADKILEILDNNEEYSKQSIAAQKFLNTITEEFTAELYFKIINQITEK